VRLGQVSAREAPRDEEPNVAPLIDIVFILLIFFVVTTTFAKDLGIDVERPAASTGTERAATVVRVAVGSGGELTVDGRATSPWRLADEVEDRLSLRPEASVLVVADVRVEAKRLVSVIDDCRRGGAEQVAVAVENAP
jgi:biopolymer transport protein ExbD